MTETLAGFVAYRANEGEEYRTTSKTTFAPSCWPGNRN